MAGAATVTQNYSSTAMFDTLRLFSMTPDNYMQMKYPNHTSIEQAGHMELAKSLDATSNVPTSTSLAASKPRNDYIKLAVRDKLFWYLMLEANNWSPEDLPIPNERFSYETKEKTEAVEMLQRSKTIPWDELKIGKGEVCTNMACGSRKPLTLDEFRIMCFLYEKNFIYTWGNCALKINGARTSCEPDSTWAVIRKDSSGEHLMTDERRDKFLAKELKQKYIVPNMAKPIPTVASMKLGELQSLAEVFGLDIKYETGKAKQKKVLHEEITASIQKID